MVIEHGLTVGGHNLRDYLEATDHAEAFALLMTCVEQQTPITLETILELHRLTMERLSDEVGRWRTRPVSMCGVPMTPPLPGQGPALMAEWINAGDVALAYVALIEGSFFCSIIHRPVSYLRRPR
jgi:Fic family protein